MKKISLSVKCKGFRETGDFESDKVFTQELKNHIKERDQGACSYCGDTFQKYQEVHHKDDDHTNSDPQNLETVCALCHACHHIGLAGVQGRGVIAYLPEMTQTQINSSYKMLMAIGQQPAIHEYSKYVVNAEPWCVLKAPFSDDKANPNIIGSIIQARVAIVENEYHEGWSNPAVLGNMLLSLDDTSYARRDDVIGDLRLVPTIAGYSNQIEHWRSWFIKTKPISTWSRIAADLEKRR